MFKPRNTLKFATVLCALFGLGGCASTTPATDPQQQALLLSQQVELLGAQDGQQTDVYYLGVAGSAEQNVFSNDVNFARHTLAKRLQVPFHPMLLGNHYYTRNELPQASLRNLNQALAAIATQMDRENDVLLLNLSSHGSYQHGLSLYMPAAIDETLTPTQLKEVLTRNQFKWKIIIVSACFSGQFIDDLADDYSLIITASDANNPSFGCSAAAEMTYFGQAYFKESFAQGRDFPSSFDHAQQVILKWEKALGYGHSNPQLTLGAQMANKLNELKLN